MRFTAALYGKLGKWSSKYANYSERFVDRYMKTKGRIIHPDTLEGKPQRCPKLPRVPRKYNFDASRPWSPQFIQDNMFKRKYRHLEPATDWHYFRGDLVEVLDGPDKGKQTRVKYIYEENDYIIADGLNTTLRVYTMGAEKMAIRYERPLLISKQVALVDPSDLEPTEVAWKYTEEGERVRVSLRTGRIIPIPVAAEETKDYKLPDQYKDAPKDTSKKDVEQVTFQPTHGTFEMDIMKSMGIEETRVPQKYYWY